MFIEVKIKLVRHPIKIELHWVQSTVIYIAWH